MDFPSRYCVKRSRSDTRRWISDESLSSLERRPRTATSWLIFNGAPWLSRGKLWMRPLEMFCTRKKYGLFECAAFVGEKTRERSTRGEERGRCRRCLRNVSVQSHTKQVRKIAVRDAANTHVAQSIDERKSPRHLLISHRG